MHNFETCNLSVAHTNGRLLEIKNAIVESHEWGITVYSKEYGKEVTTKIPYSGALQIVFRNKIRHYSPIYWDRETKARKNKKTHTHVGGICISEICA